MNVKLLDCTLRDGGYVNDWKFGQNSIRFILSKLQQSHIDIIECGYLNATRQADADHTQFATIQQLEVLLPKTRDETLYVAMIDYGTFPIDALPQRESQRLDGIRVCFRKEDRQAALAYSQQVKAKGYLVFLQPMASNTYSDNELLELLEVANTLVPYAVYFVDSFGVMKRKDVLRLFFLYDHNLSPDIRIGYHAHNNLQLAHSNAQVLLDGHTERSLIIDCSVFGMGRGAGNLNTELFVDYLNTSFGQRYDVYPLLEIIDGELNRIYAKKYWGYSLPHYLSAVNSCHPNYAGYLADKGSLTIRSIDHILSKILPENKNVFSQTLIEDLYSRYQSLQIEDVHARQRLKQSLGERAVLLLAPGPSILEKHCIIKQYIEENNPIVIAINAAIPSLSANYIFLGNQKRLEKLLETENELPPLLVSSNLWGREMQLPHNSLCFNYDDLTVGDSVLPDASGPMLIRLLAGIGVHEVALAGSDGYTPVGGNYFNEQLEYPEQWLTLEQKNSSLQSQLRELSQIITLRFVTPSRLDPSLAFTEQNKTVGVAGCSPQPLCPL